MNDVCARLEPAEDDSIVSCSGSAATTTDDDLHSPTTVRLSAKLWRSAALRHIRSRSGSGIAESRGSIWTGAQHVRCIPHLPCVSANHSNAVFC